jgi:hypothetical protein
MFLNWPPGTRTANGRALCHYVQFCRYFGVSLVSFTAITLYVASQLGFIVVVYFVMTQSGNFWLLSHALILRRYIDRNLGDDIL